MSIADKIFVATCRDIIDNGVWDTDLNVRPRWADGTPAHTVKKFGIVNRYDLAKEFPIITLRKTNFKAAVDELLWIWQKKSNNVHDLNSHIWDSWADETGSIGKAYGYQLMTNIYTFADLHEMNLYPCAYSMTFNVSGKKLNAILNQRSQDTLTANNWNVVQYAVLVHMFAQVSGLEPGELVHVIADAHIYDRHVPIVERILQNPQFNAPKFKMNPEIKNFYDFTLDDFELENYEYTPLKEKVEVAI